MRNFVVAALVDDCHLNAQTEPRPALEHPWMLSGSARRTLAHVIELIAELLLNGATGTTTWLALEVGAA